MQLKSRQYLFLLGSLVLISGMGSSIAHGWEQENSAPSEIWGGHGISMQLTGQGATLEFDCAHGSITQPIKSDAKGDFSVSGTYTPERGGPVLKASPPRDIPAVYRGAIHGESMELEIKISDRDETLPAFTLTRGNAGRLVKCR
jgi:hypothetical protein